VEKTLLVAAVLVVLDYHLVQLLFHLEKQLQWLQAHHTQ
tara:strand:- start:581 stop:697 length:117 start_codon:yes stop_codon:yes gene_type:complete